MPEILAGRARLTESNIKLSKRIISNHERRNMTVNNSNRQESRDALIRFCAGFSAGDAAEALDCATDFDDFFCDIGNIFCPGF